MTKYVITGGPGIGKTTTLLELQRWGYETVPEAARTIIEEEQQKEDGTFPWTDLYGFQEKVVARQLALERAVKKFPVFCDRGLFDNIGYCRQGQINLPPLLEEHLSRSRYTKIFILEPLANYQQDAQRREEPATARAVHNLIEQAYRDLGYEVISIPELLPRPRTELILSMI